MKSKTIEIKNLTIGYNGKNQAKTVASGISAELYSGELTCLLGANGVGKSTLLKTLSAFIPKLDGEVLIKGKDIDDYTDKQLARIIGVVLTDKCDINNITVYELVGYGRSPYTDFWGSLRKEDKEIVDEALRMMKMESFADRMVQNLSDGERQKVMIAKALAQSTPVIYLDEPTAFLDYPSKVEIMQLLHTLSRETDKTIFMSTHDIELALQISDKAWLMDKVNGIKIGTPEDLAIDGSIGQFFARKGIAFDADTGLFRVENECDKNIKLIGHGQMYTMIRKALYRNGINADYHVESDDYIETEFDSNNRVITIHINGKTTTVNSIDELLGTLNHADTDSVR
jgi:iron complex transport system ATP-binding protein